MVETIGFSEGLDVGYKRKRMTLRIPTSEITSGPSLRWGGLQVDQVADGWVGRLAVVLDILI